MSFINISLIYNLQFATPLLKMIETINGRIENLTPATVTIETASGIGFLLNITLHTFSALEGKSEAKLYVHESIREDAWVLYGFLTDDERQLFRALVGVSGVGSASARVILSAIPTAELRHVIASADSKRLKTIKGIGAKTAERIIVDLKDKINCDTDFQPEKSNPDASHIFDEALDALVILGFQRQASHKALKKVFEENDSLTIESAIKKAMTIL